MLSWHRSRRRQLLGRLGGSLCVLRSAGRSNDAGGARLLWHGTWKTLGTWAAAVFAEWSVVSAVNLYLFLSARVGAIGPSWWDALAASH